MSRPDRAPDALPGLDLRAVQRWLADTRPGLVRGELRAELVEGGRSNLTFLVSDTADPAHRWVLRRPPLGHVLATAHDMSREHRVISALAGTPVPVPAAIALCSDAGNSPDGTPFYLMGRVDGVVLRSRADLERLDADARRSVSEQLVDTLAALHAVDVEAVGLGDFGRPVGFLDRQVRRWSAQLEASRSREVAGIEDLRDRLAATVPAQRRSSVVHGDYRLDNVVLDPVGWHITGVLDWEMSTLGDPLADLGLLLVYYGAGAEGGVVVPGLEAVAEPPARHAGFLTPDEVVERYAAATGADVSNLDWYVAFGWFKLAVVLEGIHLRFTQGATVGPGFEQMGGLVPGLVEAGLDRLGALR